MVRLRHQVTPALYWSRECWPPGISMKARLLPFMEQMANYNAINFTASAYMSTTNNLVDSNATAASIPSIASFLARRTKTCRTRILRAKGSNYPNCARTQSLLHQWGSATAQLGILDRMLTFKRPQSWLPFKTERVITAAFSEFIKGLGRGIWNLQQERHIL